jgi:trans-aconitate 2-methyltransferase
LDETGFRAIRLGLAHKDMSHDSVAGLIGWLRTTWFPFTDVLPPEWRSDFLQRVADEYLAGHPPDGEGATHVAMVRLEIEARLD